MAGQGRVRKAACGFVAAGLLALSGCAAGQAPQDTTRQEIQRTLDARAAAVLDHDAGAFRTSGAGGAAGREEFENLADVPLRSWEYRLAEVRRTGDRATADAQLRYRIDGYDTAPVTTARTLELAERDGRWYVTDDRPGRDGAQQLWQQGDVGVVRGEHSLVLGVGQDRARLRQIASDADRAVPAVSAAWPGRWAGRVVVLVPDSLDAMGRLLGAPAAGYRGIAAVTTGETGGSGAAPADRVIVNPEAYGALGGFGRRFVLTHETTHVATRAHTSAATPMWLSEGFADWVAHRGTGRTAGQTAPELQRAVRAGDVPRGLPADEDFRFGTGADALARAYEGGWLACELIAERWGADVLTDFYRAVGAQPRDEGAVDQALRKVLGTNPEAFTRAWRDYVRARLR
ncbi:hypothetical protein [Streptomyces sp. NPDC001970]